MIERMSYIQDEDVANFLNEIRGIEWFYWLKRPYTIFMATATWPGQCDEVFARNGFLGLSPNNIFYSFGDLCYDKKYIKLGEEFWPKYFKTHNISELSEAVELVHKTNLKRLEEEVTSGSKSFEDRLLILSDLSQNYMPYLWLIMHLEKYFTELANQEVSKYYKGDVEKYIGDISIPIKKNEYVLMIDMLKSGASITDVQKKYGWMKSRDGFTDFYTEAEIEEIKKGIKDVPRHEVIIPKELQKLADDLRELNFFRTSRTDKFSELYGKAKPFLIELANYLGVSFNELADYDINSIIDKKPKKYPSNFTLVLNNGRYIISDKPLLEFKHNIDKEITGRTAYKGKVRGVVKVVTHPNHLSKVNVGDILVTQMTFPSFISAMQKSAAFVTDEGSIACHAAIVAREMRKPCVVGTKNATKVLKDGDMVEVDADNGTVNIIK